MKTDLLKRYFTRISLPLMVVASLATQAAQPPAPVLPIPSANQMAWQKSELLLFTHFGLKSFCQGSCPGPSGSGTGHDNVALFNPVNFDANQWAAACKAGGFKGIVVTAKHHDGFCTWQTSTTTYGVNSSPWKNGTGDVIKEVGDAFRAAGLRFGIYLSAYDIHYGAAEKVNYPTYAQFYEKQLTEVLSNYGKVDEIWFDGYGAANMVIDWAKIYQIIVSKQPECVAFAGENLEPYDVNNSIRVRWPGNENGDANDPNWSVRPAPTGSQLTVDPAAVWHPAEADVTLQGDWFYNGGGIASLDRFKQVYLTGVGRNGVSLINVAPNTYGLIDVSSVNRMKEFKAWVDSIGLGNISTGKNATASNVRGSDPAYGADKAIDTSLDSYWSPDDGVKVCTLTVDLGSSQLVRMFVIQEFIPLGQRVASHVVQTWNGTQWSTAVTAQTIGFKRIHNLGNPVTASKVRLIISQSRACPLINNFGIIGTGGGTPQPIRPTITSVRCLDSTTVRVSFSEQISTSSAQTLANYAIDNNSISITSATLDPAGLIVTLKTSALRPNVSYALTVSNISNVAQPPLSIVAGTTKSFTFASGTTRLWRFDETAGSSALESVLGGTNNIQGQAGWAQGIFGNALSFNGSTYVELGNQPDLDGSFTLSAWIKPTTSKNSQIIFAQDQFGQAGYQFRWYLEGGDHLGFAESNASGQVGTWPFETQATVALNSWTHVALVANDASYAMYINGVEAAIKAIGSAIDRSFNTRPVWIGARQSVSGSSTQPGESFEGSMDDFRIYNNPLEADEILRLYTSGNGTKLTRPVLTAIQALTPRVKIQGDHLMIEMPRHGWNDASVSVYNMAGKSVAVLPLDPAGRSSMRLTGIIKGSYLLKVSARQGTYVKKIALMRGYSD